jgi:hypothetical protein
VDSDAQPLGYNQTVMVSGLLNANARLWLELMLTVRITRVRHGDTF